ncbi:hypothetical protein ScPMuIL_003540 [Solemya velum]
MSVCNPNRMLLLKQPIRSWCMRRAIQTTSVTNKNLRAGQYKSTIHRTKPLTYEETQQPFKIGATKSWNSWNTSNLHEEGRASETTTEDMFIRKFMGGTWHRLLASEVIIKRRHNMIIIACLVFQAVPPRKMYFLSGYTEELLSTFLNCPVKVELQTVKDKKDIIFKYI